MNDALASRALLMREAPDPIRAATEGFLLARAAREQGLGVMVGCMGGTSLAMAPAILLGQVCDVVDLDGPMFLRADRADTVHYIDGHIIAPKSLWGISGSPANVAAR